MSVAGEKYRRMERGHLLQQAHATAAGSFLQRWRIFSVEFGGWWKNELPTRSLRDCVDILRAIDFAAGLL